MIFGIIENDEDRLFVEKLYEAYKYLMFAQAYRIVRDYAQAEDIIHDAFEKVIKNLHKIEREICPRTRNYLVVITRTSAFNVYNKNKQIRKKVDIVDDIEDKAVDFVSNPMNLVVSSETVKDIKMAIDNLPEIYSDIIHLNSGYKHTSDEIAELCGLSSAAVRKRLQRGREMLRQSLKKEGIL